MKKTDKGMMGGAGQELPGVGVTQAAPIFFPIATQSSTGGIVEKEGALFEAKAEFTNSRQHQGLSLRGIRGINAKHPSQRRDK